MINANIRCITRVIIEPRFRGIGLATRLVRETMPMLNVPIIESLAVMAQVNPFLERAGMQAFGTVGIEADQLIDPDAVHKQLDSLGWPASDFLETRIELFLKSHNTRRAMPPGAERTRYILHRLTQRPTYYIWHNPKAEAEPVCSDAVRRSLLCPYGHTTNNAIRIPQSTEVRP